MIPQKIPHTARGIYLLGRHYLAPGLTLEISPLVVFSSQALVNLQDGSVLRFSKEVDVSLAQDLFFEAGEVVRVWKEASFVLDPGTGLIGVEPGSEFGLYPNLLFATARFYF